MSVNTQKTTEITKEEAETVVAALLEDNGLLESLDRKQLVKLQVAIPWAIDRKDKSNF